MGGDPLIQLIDADINEMLLAGGKKGVYDESQRYPTGKIRGQAENQGNTHRS